MNVVATIRERLAALEPLTLELHDESREHEGHAGAQGGGGHFHLMIVSEQFAGKSHAARHRMDYAAVADMRKLDFHALAIKAHSPEAPAKLFPH